LDFASQVILFSGRIIRPKQECASHLEPASRRLRPSFLGEVALKVSLEASAIDGFDNSADRSLH
jgi:hypothetical protein